MSYIKYIYTFAFFVVFDLFGIILAKELVNSVENNKPHPMLQKITSSSNTHSTCKKDQDFAWCMPLNYIKENGPWEYRHLSNLTLPWYFFLVFYIFDVQEVNDKKQTITLDMYFEIKWFEPRVELNVTSAIWSKKASIIAGKSFFPIPLDYMMHFWIPDAEIYSLELYQPQNILKPTATFRINTKKLLRYITRVKIVLSFNLICSFRG